MRGAMQVISFKNTALLKRGIWLSAAALLVFVAGPAAIDGRLWQNPGPSLISIAALFALLAMFFWRTQIHCVADEVLDCHDHLQVRRGRAEGAIAFADVSSAEVSSEGGLRRIRLKLRVHKRWGRKIEFLPQASLWSNPAAIERVAAALTERANQAQRASTHSVD
jgi:hypothetical protein